MQAFGGHSVFNVKRKKSGSGGDSGSGGETKMRAR